MKINVAIIIFFSLGNTSEVFESGENFSILFPECNNHFSGIYFFMCPFLFSIKLIELSCSISFFSESGQFGMVYFIPLE